MNRSIEPQVKKLREEIAEINQFNALVRHRKDSATAALKERHAQRLEEILAELRSLRTLDGQQRGGGDERILQIAVPLTRKSGDQHDKNNPGNRR